MRLTILFGFLKSKTLIVLERICVIEVVITEMVPNIDSRLNDAVQMQNVTQKQLALTVENIEAVGYWVVVLHLLQVFLVELVLVYDSLNSLELDPDASHGLST